MVTRSLKQQKSKKVCFDELPDDMQVLLVQFFEGGGVDVDNVDLSRYEFTILKLPLKLFPIVPICTDDRDLAYATAMVGKLLPPVIVSGKQWLDGRHRVWAARQVHDTHVEAIDIHEIIGHWPFSCLGLLKS